MNLRCIAIDDEEHAIEVITDHITDMPGLKLLKSFTSSVAALTEITKDDKVDIIFMDIDMPGINGIDLAKSLREKTKYLVFTTAHPDYALQAFDVHSDQYLLKPISFAKFAKGIERILQRENDRISTFEGTDSNNVLFVKGDHKHAFANIAIDEILYVKALQNYVQIVTKDDAITTYLTLKEVEKALDPHLFIRVNKSHIIAKNTIKKVDGNSIRLSNNESVLLGDGFKQKFYEYIQKSLLKSLRK